MRTTKLCALTICALSLVCNAQQTSKPENDPNNKSDINNFIEKIIGSQADIPKGSFVFDVSKSPEVKINIPINKDLYNRFYIDGKIASSNDFTPIVKSGNWLPDTGLNLNYTHFVTTTTKFYTDELKGTLEEANINDASQLIWSWINFKAGYNYSTLETYNKSSTILNSEKFNKESVNSFIIKSDYNIYFYPSKRLVSFLSFIGNIGYEYIVNDSNYGKLQSVNIKDIYTTTDISGNTIEVSSDTKKVKEGRLIIKNTSNINYNLMALIAPSKEFYIGLSTFGKQTLTSDLKALDIGFGVTIPINKIKDSTKTLASITLKYEIPDIRNNISNIPIKEKGVLGFSIGVPLNIFRNQ